jgi:hypothetical protein
MVYLRHTQFQCPLQARAHQIEAILMSVGNASMSRLAGSRLLASADSATPDSGAPNPPRESTFGDSTVRSHPGSLAELAQSRYNQPYVPPGYVQDGYGGAYKHPYTVDLRKPAIKIVGSEDDEGTARKGGGGGGSTVGGVTPEMRWSTEATGRSRKISTALYEGIRVFADIQNAKPGSSLEVAVGAEFKKLHLDPKTAVRDSCVVLGVVSELLNEKLQVMKDPGSVKESLLQDLAVIEKLFASQKPVIDAAMRALAETRGR